MYNVFKLLCNLNIFMKEKDLQKLSKEELIRVFLDMQSENQSQISKLIKEKDEIEKENAKLHKLLEKYIKVKEAKDFIIKRENCNKFYTDSEKSTEPIVINEAEDISKKTRGRPKGSKNFANLDFEKLASKTIIQEPESLVCDCGEKLVKIDEDISFKVRIVPSDIEVTKIIRPLYKCPKCDGKIFQALCDDPFPHSVCTANLAANIIDAKYNLGVPLYRYSKYLTDRNIPLSTEDLSKYVLRTDQLLEPLYNKILNQLINDKNNVIFADETPLQVLEYKRENKKNGYIFAYISSFYNHPIYIYSFNKCRQTDELKKLTASFKGYLVCDGFKGYDQIKNDNIKIQRCFAHIRRNFYDIVKTLPESQKAQSKANEMVRRIDKLFYLENKFNKDNLSPLQIKEERHKEEYLKVVDDIYSFLHSIDAEERTPLSKAVNYFLNVEEDSKTFLMDGHIPISNNIAERAIKPFVICRKNFLFAKAECGAKASARLFSLVQTARANGLIPEYYFEYVSNNIGKVDLDDLLPWSKKLPKNISYIK